MSIVADVLAIGSCRIAENVFEGVGRRTEVEIDADIAVTIFVVVLFTVTGDMLIFDDTLAVLIITGESQSRHTITFGTNGLARFFERQDDVMQASVISEIDRGAAAAYNQDRIVFCEFFLQRVNRIIVFFQFAQQRRSAVVRTFLYHVR